MLLPSVGGGEKDNFHDNLKGSASKKRSRDKLPTNHGSDDDDNENDNSNSNSSDDDDGSDDYGENCYNGPGISAKKRRRNDEKADLELRDQLMNCPLESGLIFPSQEELYELTTIRKRNALQTFYKRFNELRQFIAIFGDANVPQQFPENHSLGIWVNKMRMERKKWDTGSERTSLTERKIELLESIDFIWAQNHKGEIGWERRFQEIKKFKRKHGHCNVPTKSAENRALGRWVSTQRTMYKNYIKGFVGKSLTREEQERRIFLLLKEGFLFSMIPNGHEGGGGTESEEKSNEGGGDATTAMEEIHDVAVPTKTISSDLTANPTAPATATPTAISSSTGVDVKADAATAKDKTATPPKPAAAATSVNAEINTIATSVSTNAKNNDDTRNQKKKDSLPDAKENNGDSFDEKKDETDDQNDSNLEKPSSSLPKTKEQIPKTEEEMAPSSPATPAVALAAQVSVTTTPVTTPFVSAPASPILSPPEKVIVKQKDASAKESDEDKTSTKGSTKDIKKPDKDTEAEQLKLTTNEMVTAENIAISDVKAKNIISSDVGTPSPPKPPTALEPKVEEKNSSESAVVVVAAEPPRSESQDSVEGASSSEVSESAPSESKSPVEPAQTSNESKEEEPPKKSTASNDTKVVEKEVSSVPFTSSPAVLKVKEAGYTTTVSLRLKDKPISRSQITPPAKVDGGEHCDVTTPVTTPEREPEEPKLVTSDGLRIFIKMEDPERAARKRTRSNSITKPSLKKDDGRSNSISTSSPSRRSVRARKPSARQLEAEKSPLRESIVGR